MSMNKFDSKRDWVKKPLMRQETQVFFDSEGDKSMTQQHHNEGGRLDTSSIVSRYFQTGVITHTRDQTARYIDAVHFQDFQSAMNSKVKADEAFFSIPLEIREELFDDDQQEFVEFCLDEKNLDKLRELGLAEPLKTTEPIKVIVENPAIPDVPKSAAPDLKPSRS